MEVRPARVAAQFHLQRHAGRNGSLELSDEVFFGDDFGYTALDKIKLFIQWCEQFGGLPCVRATEFSFNFPVSDRTATVMDLLADAYSQEDFCQVLLKVHFQGDECHSFFCDSSGEFPDLLPVKKELPVPPGVDVVITALIIGADMHSVEPDLPTDDLGVTVSEICIALPKRFYLRSLQDHPRLDGVDDGIFVPRLSIGGNNAPPSSSGTAIARPEIFW